MDKAEHLIVMAEDELTEYSTEARKIEKLRRKYSFAVPYPEQKAIHDRLEAEISANPIAQIIEENRQAIALPFWGVGGLGLLLGISMRQPIDFAATVVGFALAVLIQRWGWKLEAKRLAIKTLADIEAGVTSVQSKSASKLSK
ncbi:hypothetical protein Pse7367_0984 [Thalassoporum mexicanum PCC 7367]|uniref:hypothetical protein n=1 Tax=Thalassoporum mexicanum TaxID=3457544 RepID=UPI00029FB8A9|nr:hypothetical protein [Pseudanabaena sp. PCC 7367]AFY69283.1 hypothetical protein Pse7367_0984 [Pseudanabaena sp. PCC 7367]